MKKTLFSQEVLLVIIVGMYYAAIQFGVDPIFGVIFGTVVATFAMFFFARFAALDESNGAFGTLIATAAGFTIMTDAFVIWFAGVSSVKSTEFIIGVVVLLVMCVCAFVFIKIATTLANDVQRKLYPKSGLALLIAYNMLWPGAIVSAAYLGITLAGFGLLMAAVFLPLLLLTYTKAGCKRKAYAATKTAPLVNHTSLSPSAQLTSAGVFLTIQLIEQFGRIVQ